MRYDVCHRCEHQQSPLYRAPCCDCKKLALEDDELRKENFEDEM